MNWQLGIVSTVNGPALSHIIKKRKEKIQSINGNSLGKLNIVSTVNGSVLCPYLSFPLKTKSEKY